jgi:endoglucanase
VSSQTPRTSTLTGWTLPSLKRPQPVTLPAARAFSTLSAQRVVQLRVDLVEALAAMHVLVVLPAAAQVVSPRPPPHVMGAVTPPNPIPPVNSAPTAAAVVQAMDGGFNLGNVFDNGAKSSDFNSNKQVIDLYKNAGIKHVRFPVTWVGSVSGSSLANGSGTVNFNHSRFLQLKQLIDYALAQGMYVVLNTHHEHWLKDSYTGSATQNATFRTLWEGIANHFKAYPAQLIFEVLNEPEGAFGDWSPPGPLPTDTNTHQLTRAVNLVGYNAIRGTGGNNATRVIMVAPNAQGNQSMIDEIYPNKASLPGAGNDKYLAIQVHTYDPWNFCGQTGNNSAFPGTATISGNIQTVANHAASLGVPINYGEFGVGRATNQAERNTATVRSYYSTVADKTLSLNMSYTVWDDRGWFALVNGTNNGFLYDIVPTMRKQ